MKTFDFDFYRFPAAPEKNSTILFGGSLDAQISTGKITEAFGFDFNIHNCSVEGLSVRNAKVNFKALAEKFNAESVILHIGAQDEELFKTSPSDFDTMYLDFIGYLKKSNPKMRIQLVSIENSEHDQLVSDMNRHIKAIADAERCEFFAMESAKLWKPCSTSAAASFMHRIGFERTLNVRHPLYDVSKAIFSYVYEQNLQKTPVEDSKKAV